MGSRRFVITLIPSISAVGITVVGCVSLVAIVIVAIVDPITVIVVAFLAIAIHVAPLYGSATLDCWCRLDVELEHMVVASVVAAVASMLCVLFNAFTEGPFSIHVMETVQTSF